MSNEVLKIAIEEIVAPLSADPRLKDRYRKELLGHLTELVEDELTQGGDTVETLRAALERLGDPDTLRTDFMDSLSRLDRAFGKADLFFEKRPHESSLQFALRGSGVFALGILLFIVTLFAPVIAGITSIIGPEPGVVVFLPIFGLFLVLYAVPVLFFGLLIDAPARRAKWKRNWGVYTLYALVLLVFSIFFGAICMGIGRVLLVSALGNHHSEIYVFDSAAGVTIAGTALAILASTTIGELILRPRIYNGISGWPYRDVV